MLKIKDNVDLKDNPFDFKEAIIAHCRTLDKYDVYQWLADDEVKINNLLEENQQLKEQLEASEKARKEAIDKLKTLGKFDGERCTRSFKLWTADFNELISVLDIDKGE